MGKDFYSTATLSELGGYGEKKSYDLCDKCMAELKQWMEVEKSEAWYEDPRKKPATVGEMEDHIRSIWHSCNCLGRRFDDALVEMRALSATVEELKKNVKSMQDEVI